MNRTAVLRLTRSLPADEGICNSNPHLRHSGSRLFAGFNIPEHKAPVASEEMKYLLTSLRISLSNGLCKCSAQMGDGSAGPAGIPESGVLIKEHFLDLVCVCCSDTAD